MTITEYTFPKPNYRETFSAWKQRVSFICEFHGETLNIKPSPSHFKIFMNHPEQKSWVIDILELHEYLYAHKRQRFKEEKFKAICFDVGIPEDGRLIKENGDIEAYTPDSQGWPTLVVILDKDGKSKE